jgi:hypothetical protein
MSDVQQGPDWWLASDGKWYPPQSRPFPAPPPAPPPAPTFSPGLPPPPQAISTNRVLAGWLQGLLWVSAVSAGLTAIFAIQAISAATSWWNDERFSALDEWVDAEDAYTAFFGLFSLVSIAVFVLLIIWAYRIHSTSSLLWPYQRKWSRGWTVGAWFIPLANFIIVPLVLQEVWRILRSPRSSEGTRGGWETQPADGLLTGWWVAYGLGVVLTNGISVANSDELFDDLSSYTTPMWVGVIGQVFVVVAVVCATLFVRRVTARLSEIQAINR